MPVWLNDLGIVSALGTGHQQTIDSINSQHSNTLTATDELAFAGRSTYVGMVKTLPLSAMLRTYALIDDALAQIKPTLEQFKVAEQRIAVVVGTSTASIHEGERSRKQFKQTGQWPRHYSYSDQALVAPAHYIAKQLHAGGPCYSISTACSSSSKAMISARALLLADLADVVICGGVDSLCQLTVNGFDSLSSISDAVCQPFSLTRSGINIGEGAALFVMSKKRNQGQTVAFLGGGESSDAHHISAPAPDGSGAEQAMCAALRDANITADAIDYINAHGTATQQNDAMESLAINRVFGNNTPVSSSKHLSGHTLGAAGAIEAGICWLSLIKNDCLATLPFNSGDKDPSLGEIALLTSPFIKPLKYCLSNSFAFGGNNVSVVLGLIDEQL
ncbi:beta-ketoacyl-[acyl-carrier-protein] synthase II [Pseudoalteromonas sp. S1727]|uniref:beta-ketoacyl-ACP synthase n=1 Tax=Pseudoalteromonas sp. S1727 TaxID=2066514 RepID=UPI001108D87B|nr:beta-ketoacyl-ACP synthase [Pseudoalteromonas sp. S1727]TMN73287.1 beta-ketoacyl-[acyl-carrier-protein] synthase II [Pseudoalteromonas sp. S1727]